MKRRKLIRAYAATLGWKRGHPPIDGGIGKRRDLCPNRAPAEAAKVAAFAEERAAKKKKARREERAAKRERKAAAVAEVAEVSP